MTDEWCCSICLENNQEDCYTLNPCNHKFHTKCIIDSLRLRGKSCPYCRGVQTLSSNVNNYSLEDFLKEKDKFQDEIKKYTSYKLERQKFDPLFKLIGTTSKQAGFKKKDGFLNGDKIKDYIGPLLIIHAERDHIVPFSQGELLYNSCSSENKKFLPIPNANHNNILGVNPQRYFDAIEKFVNH